MNDIKMSGVFNTPVHAGDIPVLKNISGDGSAILKRKAAAMAINKHDGLVEENNILTNARLKSDAKNIALSLENEHFLGVLKLLKADLLERSEKDSQGMKVVNISSSVWEIAKETIYRAKKKDDNNE